MKWIKRRLAKLLIKPAVSLVKWCCYHTQYCYDCSLFLLVTGPNGPNGFGKCKLVDCDFSPHEWDKALKDD